MTLIEVVLLTAGITGLLAVVGVGPVLLLVPDFGGAELFFAPFVGLALLYWVTQWLSPHFASGPVVATTCAACGLISLAVLWSRREAVLTTLRAVRVDVAIVAGCGIVFAVLLLLPLLHAGTLTLADYSGDELSAWAPVAGYMQAHPYAAGHPTAYNSTLFWLLPLNIYPGSAGTVDGGLLTVFGLKSYQFVEPFAAVCLALNAGTVYVLLRSMLRVTRPVAVLGLLFAVTNGLTFFIAGDGLDQAALGMALMTAVFAILIRALQKRSWRLTALAGGMTGILAGVYFPVFAIAALAGVCGMAILLIRARLTGDKVRWQVPVCYVASGLVLGLQNAWWLLIDGGLHAWSAQLPAGRVKFDSITASFQSLTGSVSLWPNAPFEPWWSRVAVVVASLAVLLLLVGAVSLIRRDLLAAACLVPPLLAGAIIYVHGAGGSASVLIVAYLSPIACALAAYGVARLIAMRSTASRSTRPQRYAHHPRARGYAASTVVLIAALVVILALRTGSAYEGEAFAINSGGILPRADLGLSRLGSAVPPRAGVLMYTVAGPVQDIQHATNMLAEAALLLPDRNVAIIGALAPSKASTTVDQAAPGYPYILSYSEGGAPDSSVPSSYRAVLRLPRQNLVLYERAGATT